MILAMNQELDDALCAKYPSIFSERHGSPQDTSMCWGFECGNGWYILIDTLCAELQAETERNGAPQVIAKQVKAKFGSLRFYSNPGLSERQHAMIDFASALSQRTCEICGAPAQRVCAGRDMTTRCEAHQPDRQGKAEVPR